MKKILFIVPLLWLSLTVSSQSPLIRDLFIALPDSIYPLLSKTNREDLVDFLEAKMVGKVTNRLEGTSYMRTLTDRFILLKSSSSGETAFRLLPLASGGEILCVVNTVSAEASDSRARFFTTDWKELPSEQFFQMPSLSEFIVPNDSLTVDTILSSLEKVDIYLVQLILSPEEDSVTAQCTIPLYMNKEEATKLSPCLRTLSYRWDGNRFIRE